MENTPELKAAPAPSSAGQTCCAGSASGGGLNRRTLYIGIGISAAAGMFLGWDWLVAIGAASVIIALAPCLIMCGAMCAMRMCQNKKSEVPATADAVNTDAPVTRTAADDVPATNATAHGAIAMAALPDAAETNTAAADLAVARAALESAPNTPASEARA